MKWLALFVSLAVSAVSSLTLAAAPIKNDGVLASLIIPDTYIVKYKADADAARRKQHESDVHGRARNASKQGIFDTFNIPGLQGYVAEIPPADLDALRNSDLIDYIERDTLTRTTAHLHPKRTIETQLDPPWGLARISHRNHPPPKVYAYSSTAGADIRIYILDTGIRLTHSDFHYPHQPDDDTYQPDDDDTHQPDNDDPHQPDNDTPISKTEPRAVPQPDNSSSKTKPKTRAVWGANFIPSSPNRTDDNGHGTHVAGIAAGTIHGVAKSAIVVAVKVLDKDGEGSMSGLLRGLQWAVADAKKRGVQRRSVVNMSVTGSYTKSVEEGVKAAAEAGMTIVVAAGNSGGNATEWSPASAGMAVTVGAIDEEDRRAEFSNWGGSVDVFAPGVKVVSASWEGDGETVSMSGTSMAAPHVAGLAAYFIAREGLEGRAVAKRVLGMATKGVRDRKGSADRIAYNGVA